LKAHIVTNGYIQMYGLDSDTLSRNVKVTFIHLFLSMNAKKSLASVDLDR